MVAFSKIEMTDIAKQKRFETRLDGDLTPRHNVGQAVEHYLATMKIPKNDVRWTAFSRGVRLDKKILLENLDDTFAKWSVIPQVSAGSGSI